MTTVIQLFLDGKRRNQKELTKAVREEESTYGKLVSLSVSCRETTGGGIPYTEYNYLCVFRK